MKTSVKFFALMAMVFAIGACDEMGVPSSPASDNLFQIEAVPAGDFTRATDTAFEEGDALSVSVFKGTLMEYWIGNGKFTKTANGFVADKDYYWYEGTDVCTIVGFYPYASYTAESILSEGINFCVKSDQSTHAGYTASDLMVSLSNNVAPTTDKVTLTFNHLLSKVVVDVKNETSSEIANVYFDGVQAYYSYSLLGSSIKGGAGTIKAGQLATPSEGYTNSFALIIPPQVVAPTLAITTVDGKEYKRPASEAIDFGSGKVRHLTATITEESVYIEFDAIVNDWSADEDVEFADQPNGGENPDTPVTITPIADILALGTGATIGSATVEGVVISNLELNNLTSKKGLYIQDETAGLQLYLAANHEFKFGDKVQIDLSGATVGEYNGAVQISGLALDKVTVLSSGNNVEPKTVSIEEFLSNKYESQYVAIEGVQVVDADLSKTWVMDGSHTNITMEDALGNTFVVFSSKYATYGANAVAQGSGTIKGIAGNNKGNIQIIFAQESDYADLTDHRHGEMLLDGMEVNPNWSATYVPEFYDEESGQTYKDLVEIVSTDENNGFFFEFISEDYYLENIAPDVKGYVNGVAEHLTEYLNDFNAEGGTDYDFTIYTYYKYGLYDMYWIMNPGKWRVAMWGMTTEGEVTGLYYISDMIEVIDPATPEYLSWLGTFVISEQGESTTTSTITITRNEVNESYWVSGWNNIENSIVAGFDPDGGWEGSGSLEFYAQTVLSDFYVGDTHIVDLYFGGLVTVGDALAPLVTAGDKLAQADWLGDTNSTFINHYTYSVDGEEAPVTQIGFLASLDDGRLTYITAEIHSIKTSLKMNRVENTEPAAVARKHNPLDVGNNGAARPLEEVRKVRKPQISNYVVGGRKFNAVNF